MSWKTRLFSLKGRMGRNGWWTSSILLTLVDLWLTVSLIWLLGGPYDYYWEDVPLTPAVPLAEAIIFVVLLRPWLAVDIKRIHDLGLTAYLLLPRYIFYLVFIMLEARDLTTDDFWGTAPGMAFIGSYALYMLWLIFLLGFRKGTDGPSKYGPDPQGILTPATDEAI